VEADTAILEVVVMIGNEVRVDTFVRKISGKALSNGSSGPQGRCRTLSRIGAAP
jgi:hypothetical protein